MKNFYTNYDIKKDKISKRVNEIKQFERKKMRDFLKKIMNKNN